LYFWQISWLGLCRLPGDVPDHPRFWGAFAGQATEVWSSDQHVLHQFSAFMFWPEEKKNQNEKTLSPRLPFPCRKALS